MTIKGNYNASDKVKVAIRVRPFSRRECQTQRVVQIAGETVFLAHPNEQKPPRPFAFDFCFASGSGEQLDNSIDSVASSDSFLSQNAQQEHVFRAVGMEVVENAFLGFNTCVFAYGQTGSGKSYTMMGTVEEPGIIPRLCTELFQRVDREAGDANRFKVEISFYEVYNERIRDLLGRQSAKRQPLRVREHSLFGPMVEGLSVFVVNSYDQVEQLIAEGNSARTTAATLMNDESSRSHSVFTIKLTQTIADADDKTFTGEKISKISLVDLAGSERVQKTGATGKRLEEGGNINKSLTALGKVISALASESQQQKRATGNFIPYRDSVLTWLLKENLGGNSRTTMIATISPSSDNFEETLSTLRFADRAKRIQTHAIVNEDPNAKVIRELREEVERLRQLNQSHAQQQEIFQAAMEQIAERHQQDKQKALEKQYEQFSQYIRELTQNLQTPSSSSTPMTPFGTGMFTPSSVSPSPSMLSMHRPNCGKDMNNNNGPISSKRKFLEWARRREELFTQRLATLRLAIQRAHALATEANSLVALLWAQSIPGRMQLRPHFAINLQIPACNLRPSKLALTGRELLDNGDDETAPTCCVCEPVIVVSWEGLVRGMAQQQQLSIEQMESKLIDLKAMFANGSLTFPPDKAVEMCENGRNNLMPIFGNLLERHSLIGVANIYLGALLHDLGPHDTHVLIINQHGEICGKLHVQIQRLAISRCSFEDSDDSTPESNEELDLSATLANEGPEKLLGRTLLCRVEIKKAINLPQELSNFVFCQYSFYERPEVVVASHEQHTQQFNDTNANCAAANTTITFNSANEFELVCTRPFLEYVEEDALSIEVWGHRLPGEDEDEEIVQAEALATEQFDGEWEELECMDGSVQQQQSVCEVAERKKKSLQERWLEVTKQLDLWLELLELNAEGEYAPVPVEANDSGCSTGGIYRLRQGQQRRARIIIKTNSHSEESAGGLPLCLEDVLSVSIGSLLVLQQENGGEHSQGLDSYQELDLFRLRAEWEEVLQRRANYLQKEIHALASKSTIKSELDEEREKSLLLNWVELVEERNAISIPTAGIPGAPAERQIPLGYEQHCPLLFLQGEQQIANNEDGSDNEENEAEWENGKAAAVQNLLPFEDQDSQLELVFAEKEITENQLSCVCSWDSSLHGWTALNRQSRKEERVFLLLKVVIRISQPFCMDLVLRKRICLQLCPPNSQSASRWPSSFPWTRRASCEQLTGTGLFVDVVACIPRSTLDLESREMLARLAVQHATNGEHGEEEHNFSSFSSDSSPEQPEISRSNYLSEYVSKTIQAVEWLIKMDRLRQEEALGRALARHHRAQMKPNCSSNLRSSTNTMGRMKRTISLPTTMSNYLSSSQSFQTKFEPIEDASGESSLESTPMHQKLERPNNRLPPSQSHTEGFMPAPTAISNAHSPNSSGYASMADSGQEGRQRPNSLDLGGGELKLRKMLLLSMQGTKMESVVSPGALRLTGIEEEGLPQQQHQNHHEVNCTEKEFAEATTFQRTQGEEATIEAAAHQKQSAEAAQFAQEATSTGNNNGTAPAAAATLPASPTPQAVNGESGAAAELRPCCCENRLFSPPSPPAVPAPTGGGHQRKLFFQNTINSSAIMPPVGGNNGRPTTVSNAAFAATPLSRRSFCAEGIHHGSRLAAAKGNSSNTFLPN